MSSFAIPSLTNKTVVIVDDDDLLRALLRGMLRSIGMQVVGEAGDGPDALSRCAQLKPQIVCLDINMPTMNGIEVLTKLRETNSELIVLIISASATADNVKQSLQSRADGFIVKPFSAEKISREIERAFARRAEAKSETAAKPGA